MLERDLEDKQREAEEETRQVQAAVAQSAPDMNGLWNTTFPWAGLAPMLIDLIGPDDDDDA